MRPLDQNCVDLLGFNFVRKWINYYFVISNYIRILKIYIDFTENEVCCPSGINSFLLSNLKLAFFLHEYSKSGLLSKNVLKDRTKSVRYWLKDSRGLYLEMSVYKIIPFKNNQNQHYVDNT